MLADLLARRPADSRATRDLGTDPEPYLVLFVIGFLIAVLGHIVKSKTLIATGILMIFLSTVLLPLVARSGY